MDLREIEWDSMNWIYLVQVMNLRVPYNAEKFLNSWSFGDF
jgi:hypothetical protein